jgi:hypothetical protein
MMRYVCRKILQLVLMMGNFSEERTTVLLLAQKNYALPPSLNP